MKRLIESLKIVIKIFKSNAFKPYFKNFIVPKKEFQHYDEIEEHIRSNSEGAYHPVGTCKMGLDNLAVVNSELKVHGVRCLRIADASIMPMITSGNTNAPSMMIGEKASDMILKESQN